MDDAMYDHLLAMARKKRYRPDARTHIGKEFLIRIVTAQAGDQIDGEAIIFDDDRDGGIPFPREMVIAALKATKWDHVKATFRLMGR